MEVAHKTKMLVCLSIGHRLVEKTRLTSYFFSFFFARHLKLAMSKYEPLHDKTMYLFMSSA